MSLPVRPHPITSPRNGPLREGLVCLFAAGCAATGALCFGSQGKPGSQRQFPTARLLANSGAACNLGSDLGIRESFPAPARQADLAAESRALAGLPFAGEAVAPPAGRSASRPLIWRTHAAVMEAHWKLVREHRARIEEWRAQQGVAEPQRPRTVLYPFSGSDLPNAYSFFPDAPAYIMIALEEPGQRPRIQSLRDSELRSGLAALRDTVRGIARNNYLFTRTITRMAHNPYVRGAAPTLLAYVARLGGRPHSIMGVRIGPDGSLLPDNTASAAGVRIAFTGATGSCSVLYYLRLHISDTIADPKTPEGAFLSGLAPVHLFMKSAAYVLHSVFGPTERAAVALRDKTVFAVQDDSGLPVRLFQPDGWRRSVFGRYTTHLFAIQDIGRPPRQKALEQLYADQKPARLPFRFGYGALRGKLESNLMIFARLTPD